MTDKEKAEAAVNAYSDLRNTALGRALIIDIALLLKREREELLEALKAVIEKR
jgi:hypothetical protein